MTVVRSHITVVQLIMRFIFCAWADNYAVLLFINKVGGSRRGLSNLAYCNNDLDNRGCTVLSSSYMQLEQTHAHTAVRTVFLL